MNSCAELTCHNEINLVSGESPGVLTVVENDLPKLRKAIRQIPMRPPK